MGAEPDELRRDVEQSRAHLAQDVDRLADRVVPGRVARRKADAVQNRFTGVKERVMGTAHSGTGTARGAVRSVADGAGQTAGRVGGAVKDTGDQLGDTARQTPDIVKRQTQGSPLAAGLIAFGAGMLAAALLPTTSAEERAGAGLREHADDLVEPVKQAALESAQNVKEELREPAAEAVGSVQDTAREAVRTTGDKAREAGQESAEGLRATGQEAVTEVRDPHGSSY
jgi:gas vesicle protein